MGLKSAVVVEYTGEEEGMFPVGNLPDGGVFIYRGVVFIATATVDQTSGHRHCLAIETGHITDVDRSAYVLPVRAKLVVFARKPG